MADRARHAEARAQRRQEATEVVVAGEEMVNEEGSDDNEEMEKAPVRVPQRIERGPAVALRPIPRMTPSNNQGYKP